MGMGFVIVGAGQAGYALAAKLRRLGYEGEISLVGEEPYLPYQRPPLSKKYLLGDMDAVRLEFRPAAFYADANITVISGNKVEAINRIDKTVLLDDGKSLGYDKLALTTGSRPRRLPDEMGMGLGGVHQIRSISDIDELKPALKPGRHIFIVGAGYIGLEAAAVCRVLGLEVTVIEAEDRVLARVAAPETSVFFQDLHHQHGVDVKLATGLAKLHGVNGRLERAQLSDGSDVACDLAIVGIGALPNAELAEKAGLTIDNGIAVNQSCQTSDKNIYAAGDCASFPLGDGRIRLESVQNAIDQAEAAAAAMIGEKVEYVPQTWFWSDQYDVKMQIAGLNSGYETTMQCAGARPGASSVWYFRQNVAIAVDSINDPKTHMAARRLFEQGVALTQDEISAPDFDIMQRMKQAAKS